MLTLVSLLIRMTSSLGAGCCGDGARYLRKERDLLFWRETFWVLGDQILQVLEMRWLTFLVVLTYRLSC